jgi:8-amino-7-oxononanoate synthase
VRDTLLNRARSFVFSTAPLPVLCAGLEAGLDVLAAEPGRRTAVHRKAELLRGALREAGRDVSHDRSPDRPRGGRRERGSIALQQGLGRAGFDAARYVRRPSPPARAACV